MTDPTTPDTPAASALSEENRAPKWQWLTTMPNPRRMTNNADNGQRGWRTHAVWASDDATGNDIRRTQSACGLTPSHGWGVDMFIEIKCARCVRAVERRDGVNPETEREQLLRRERERQSKEMRHAD